LEGESTIRKVEGSVWIAEHLVIKTVRRAFKKRKILVRGGIQESERGRESMKEKGRFHRKRDPGGERFRRSPFAKVSMPGRKAASGGDQGRGKKKRFFFKKRGPIRRLSSPRLVEEEGPRYRGK